VAASVFFVMRAFGLLIGPGITGGTSVLAATFTFGGNLGGAKLILVARVTCVLVVLDVLCTPPLVSFEVPCVSFVVPFVNFVVLLVVTLLSGFFAGAEVGRLLTSFGELLVVSGCLLVNVDVRGIFGFNVVVDFVANTVLGVVGILGDDTSVVLVIEVRGVVIKILAEVDGVPWIVVLGAGFGETFVIVVAFKVVVFKTVGDRTLVIGLEADGAVVGLDNSFDVVDKFVFLIGADVLEVNGFVEEFFIKVVLALEIVVSNFLGADFFEAKLAPATAATATVPTTVVAAISATCN